MTTVDAAPQTTSAVLPPHVREVHFADFPRIRDLELTAWPDGLAPEQRRSLFVDHPLWPRLADTWPLGWVFEDDEGAIVGSVTNIPAAYVIGGEEKLCAIGHCWVVRPEYRTFAAMLMDEYFNQEHADLHISAHVGPPAEPVWSAYGRRVPVGDWATAAYAITRYRDFARTALRMKKVPLAGAVAPLAALAFAVKDRVTSGLPDDPPGVEFTEAPSFDARFDAFWAERVAQNPATLLAVRDSATLRWHYGLPMRAGRAVILTATRGDRLLAYCVLKKDLKWQKVPTLRLVDFQTVEPGTDLLAGLVRLARRWAADEGCCVLEHTGCGLPAMRSFDAFAPYRAAKTGWCFYYSAADPALETVLEQPEVWDPSEYDGDSSCT